MKLDEKFAKAFSDAMIARLKMIEESAWETPWFECTNTAVNLDGVPYGGCNALLLNFLLSIEEQELPVYMTFLRAKKEGLAIKKGELSVPVQYAEMKVRHKDTRDVIPYDDYTLLSDEEKKDYVTSFFLTHYNVFNVSQTNMKDARPDLYEELVAKHKGNTRTSLADLDSHPLEDLVQTQEWYTPIYQDQQARAFYSLMEDAIHLPKRASFKSDALYFSTLLHEMAHSTGHSSRLDRNMTSCKSLDRYGREELVAELSAAMTGQRYGLSKSILEGNAHYLKSWLSSIGKDPDFLGEILGDVLKASDFMISRIEERKSLRKENGLATEQEGTKATKKIARKNKGFRL